MIKNLADKVKRHFHEVIKLKKSPHSIALGFAAGTLIGTLPIPFIDFFIGLIVIAIFKNINKYSLFAAIVLWNPLTKIPIYTLSYSLGDILFGSAPVINFELVLFNNIYNYSRRFLVGNIIIAFALSIASYFIVKIIANKVSKK